MKICRRCGHDKRLDEYNRCGKAPDGLQYWCRECQRSTKAAWKASNKEAVTTYTRRYERQRKATDPEFKLKKTFSCGIRKGLVANGASKAGQHCYDMVPYTPDELIAHLESQFDEHMTWDNYGEYWHIDHCRPQASFDLSDPTSQDFQICWSLANLRPLEASENISKGDEIDVDLLLERGIPFPGEVVE